MPALENPVHGGSGEPELPANPSGPRPDVTRRARIAMTDSHGRAGGDVFGRAIARQPGLPIPTCKPPDPIMGGLSGDIKELTCHFGNRHAACYPVDQRSLRVFVKLPRR